MNSVRQFDPNDILPHCDDVYGLQGIPKKASVPQSIQDLYADAIEIYVTCSRPAAIMRDVSLNDFSEIFGGEGRNAVDAHLQHVFPHADYLSLMALTLGKDVATAIRKLFDESDYATGTMLDSVASCSVERAVETCEAMFGEEILGGEESAHDLCVLNYSPGYCGWHVSGQKKLFEYLKPGRIGITLNDSSLMTPIKSTTGVLIAGKREIHRRSQCSYSYCDECKDRTCVSRAMTICNSQ